MQGACRLEEPSEQSPSSGGYLFFYCTFFLWVGVQATLWDAHLQSYWNCQHFRAFKPFPPLQYWFGTDYIEREGTICKSNLHLKGPFFKALIADPEKMPQMLHFSNLPWASKNGGAVSGTWIFGRKTSKLTLSRSSEPKIWSLLLHLHVF